MEQQKWIQLGSVHISVTLGKSAGSTLLNQTFSCHVLQRPQIVCGIFNNYSKRYCQRIRKKYTTCLFFSKVSSTGEARIIKESYIIIKKEWSAFEKHWGVPNGIQVIVVCSAASVCLTFQMLSGTSWGCSRCVCSLCSNKFLFSSVLHTIWKPAVVLGRNLGAYLK